MRRTVLFILLLNIFLFSGLIANPFVDGNLSDYPVTRSRDIDEVPLMLSPGDSTFHIGPTITVEASESTEHPEYGFIFLIEYQGVSDTVASNNSSLFYEDLPIDDNTIVYFSAAYGYWDGSVIQIGSFSPANLLFQKANIPAVGELEVASIENGEITVDWTLTYQDWEEFWIGTDEFLIRRSLTVEGLDDAAAVIANESFLDFSNQTGDDYSYSFLDDTGLSNGNMYYYRIDVQSVSGYYMVGIAIEMTISDNQAPVAEISSDDLITAEQTITINWTDDDDVTTDGQGLSSGINEFEIYSGYSLEENPGSIDFTLYSTVASNVNQADIDFSSIVPDVNNSYYIFLQVIAIDIAGNTEALQADEEMLVTFDPVIPLLPTITLRDDDANDLDLANWFSNDIISLPVHITWVAGDNISGNTYDIFIDDDLIATGETNTDFQITPDLENAIFDLRVVSISGTAIENEDEVTFQNDSDEPQIELQGVGVWTNQPSGTISWVESSMDLSDNTYYYAFNLTDNHTIDISNADTYDNTTQGFSYNYELEESAFHYLHIIGVDESPNLGEQELFTLKYDDVKPENGFSEVLVDSFEYEVEIFPIADSVTDNLAGIEHYRLRWGILENGDTLWSADDSYEILHNETFIFDQSVLSTSNDPNPNTAHEYLKYHFDYIFQIVAVDSAGNVEDFDSTLIESQCLYAGKSEMVDLVFNDTDSLDVQQSLYYLKYRNGESDKFDVIFNGPVKPGVDNWQNSITIRDNYRRENKGFDVYYRDTLINDSTMEYWEFTVEIDSLEKYSSQFTMYLDLSDINGNDIPTIEKKYFFFTHPENEETIIYRDTMKTIQFDMDTTFTNLELILMIDSLNYGLLGDFDKGNMNLETIDESFISYYFMAWDSLTGAPVLVTSDFNNRYTLMLKSEHFPHATEKVFIHEPENSYWDLIDDSRFLSATEYVRYFGLRDYSASLVLSKAVALAFEPVNYPNPFGKGSGSKKEETVIRYFVDSNGDTEISIFDLFGNLVIKHKEVSDQIGVNEWVWNGNNGKGEEVASGVYLCLINGDIFKIAIIRE